MSCSAEAQRLTAESNNPAHVELVLATPDQERVLANLLELYAHDFSEFHPLELNASGRFGYPQLPEYWRQPDHYPFLIRANGQLAGLVLVKRSRAIWDIAEFFVVRAYRRQGIGMKIAQQIWGRFPGPWEVRVMQSNRTALDFWQRAIEAFNGEAIEPSRVERAGQIWFVFRFESKAAVARLQ